MVNRYEHDVSHVRVFRCLVNALIEPPKHSKFGPWKRQGICASYESSCIICYLKPLTNDLFNAKHAYCGFDETIFLSLRGYLYVNVDKERCEIMWYVPNLFLWIAFITDSNKKVQ